MAIGAYTMAILVLKAGFSFWLSLPCAVGASMLFGVIVGLPSLRLRADYFAIATIAMAEVVRLFAQNARGLTGGNQGLFCDIENPSNCYPNAWNDISESINNFISNFWTDPPTLLPLLIVIWVTVGLSIFVLRRLQRHSLGTGAACDPGGRGRRPGARQEHAASTSSSRWRSRRCSARSRDSSSPSTCAPCTHSTSSRW